jgi:hypothetical protein
MQAQTRAKGGTNHKDRSAASAAGKQKGRKRGGRITRYALTVEAAGAMAGMSKSASYRAVKSGLIPILGEGRNRIVPRLIWEAKLGIKSEADPPLDPSRTAAASHKSHKAKEEATEIA